MLEIAASVAAEKLNCLKVAGEGIIEPKSSVELEGRAGDKLQLAPSSCGFHTGGSGNAGDVVRSGQDVLVGSSTQSPERSATIGFAGKRKPSENRNLPIASYRPGMDLSGTRVELMCRISAYAQSKRPWYTFASSVGTVRDPAFVARMA